MNGQEQKSAAKPRRGTLKLTAGQFHYWGDWYRKRVDEALRIYLLGPEGFHAKFAHDQLITMDVVGSVELAQSDFDTLYDFTFRGHPDQALREEGKVAEADEVIRQRDRVCEWLRAGWTEIRDGEQPQRQKFCYSRDPDEAAAARAEAKQQQQASVEETRKRRQLAKECEEVGPTVPVPLPGNRPREPPAPVAKEGQRKNPGTLFQI